MSAALLLLLPLGAAQAHARQKPAGGGGASLLLEVKAEGPRASAAVERTAVVIRRRCARLGVRCRIGARAGGVANRLALSFATTKETGRVRNVLLAEGLELRAVVSPGYPAPILEYVTRPDAEVAVTAGTEALTFLEPGRPPAFLVAERAPIIDGDVLRSPVVVRAPREVPGGGYVVDARLDRAGAARLSRWMADNVGRYVAVVFNGRALSAVYVKAPVSYNVILSGGFDRRQAEDAAAVLAGGRLPAPVEVLEETTRRP